MSDLIKRELTDLADTLYARGLENKHEIPWLDLLEEEFATWLVDKFKSENLYADLLEKAALKGADDDE